MRCQNLNKQGAQILSTKWVKCSPDDPNACKADIVNGPCPYKAVDGFKYCPRHNSNAVKRQEESKYVRYKLGLYQERVQELTNETGIKSLRDEIGILRMTLEETVKLCTDATQLQMRTQTIQGLVLAIEKVVKSCHALDVSMSMVLDQSTIMSMAIDITTAIADRCDKDTAELLADDIGKILTDAIEPEETVPDED